MEYKVINIKGVKIEVRSVESMNLKPELKVIKYTIKSRCSKNYYGCVTIRKTTLNEMDNIEDMIPNFIAQSLAHIIMLNNKNQSSMSVYDKEKIDFLELNSITYEDLRSCLDNTNKIKECLKMIEEMTEMNKMIRDRLSKMSDNMTPIIRYALATQDTTETTKGTLYPILNNTAGSVEIVSNMGIINLPRYLFRF